MKLDSSNLYVKAKDGSKGQFVVCIELPDGSRNHLHSQEMVLNECVAIADELRGIELANDANEPYLESDGTYFRIKMTIPNSKLTIDHELYFHSRKLNLNDAVKERQLLLDDQNTIQGKCSP